MWTQVSNCLGNNILIHLSPRRFPNIWYVEQKKLYIVDSISQTVMQGLSVLEANVWNILTKEIKSIFAFRAYAPPSHEQNTMFRQSIPIRYREVNTTQNRIITWPWQMSEPQAFLHQKSYVSLDTFNPAISCWSILSSTSYFNVWVAAMQLAKRNQPSDFK